MRLGVFEVVSRAVPRWIAQASKTCAGDLPTRLAIASDDRIFQQIGLAAMAQGGESLQHDAIRFAIVQKLPLRQIRVGFDVNDGGLDPGGVKDVLHLLQADVGQSNGPAPALIHQALERPPCFPQRHPVVINHIAACIPGVLLLPGLERKRRVDEIKVDEVQPRVS